MDKVAIVLATMICSFIWFCHLEGEARKDYTKAGYIVIDKQAYRLTPVENDSRKVDTVTP